MVLCSGSDAASIQSRATLSEDGKHFLLNGSKVCAVSDHAELAVLNFLRCLGRQWCGGPVTTKAVHQGTDAQNLNL